MLKSHGAILHSPAGYMYEHDTSSVMGSTGSDIDASMQGLGAEPQGVSRGAPMFRFVAGDPPGPTPYYLPPHTHTYPTTCHINPADPPTPLWHLL